jgi:uncharacterized protein (TIGR03067 family)
MRRMTLLPLVLCLIAADDAKKELERFQGDWVATRYVIDGKSVETEAITLSVKGDESTYTRGDSASKGTYRPNPAKDPKELDIVVTSGPDKGKTYLAIYEFAGEELRICLTRTGKERPTKFTSAKGTDVTLEVWQRKK